MLRTNALKNWNLESVFMEAGKIVWDLNANEGIRILRWGAEVKTERHRTTFILSQAFAQSTFWGSFPLVLLAHRALPGKVFL